MTLLQLEELHDIYCPDFTAKKDNYNYYAQWDGQKYYPDWTFIPKINQVYFNNIDTIARVCHIMNEKEN